MVFFGAAGAFAGPAGGFIAAACAGRYFAMIGGIDLRHRRIRQTGPDLILAQQRDAEIAAHRQRLPIGAQRHLGLVDLAVARIEHVAVLVFQSVALHVADEGRGRATAHPCDRRCISRRSDWADRRARERAWRTRLRRRRRDRPPETIRPACPSRPSATARPQTVPPAARRVRRQTRARSRSASIS